MDMDPVSKLPSEVATKVFTEVLHPQYNECRGSRRVVPAPLGPFLRLRLVSSQWDRYVMSVSKDILSRQIYIDSAKRFSSLIRFVQRCDHTRLKRLRLDGRWDWGSEEPASCKAVPEGLFESIETLEMCMSLAICEQVLRRLQPTLVSIDRLVVQVTKSTGCPYQKASAISLPIELPIREVHFKGASNTTDELLAFAALTFTNLETLDICVLGAPSGLAMLNVGKLKHLSLSYTAHGGCLDVLSKCGARLESLAMRNNYRVIEQRLLDADLSCLCELQSLDVSGNCFLAEQIVGLLLSTRGNLQRLALSGLSLGLHNFVGNLDERFSPAVLAGLCPLLDEISLERCGLGIYWIDSLFQLFADRKSPSRSYAVEKLVLAGEPQLDAEALLALFTHTALQVKTLHFYDPLDEVGEVTYSRYSEVLQKLFEQWYAYEIIEQRIQRVPACR